MQECKGAIVFVSSSSSSPSWCVIVPVFAMVLALVLVLLFCSDDIIAMAMRLVRKVFDAELRRSSAPHRIGTSMGYPHPPTSVVRGMSSKEFRIS